MAVDYKKELDLLIATVVNEHGSDLHLSVGSHPSIRVSGSLIPLLRKPILTEHDVNAFAKALMRGEFFERLERREEVDFSYEAAGKVRFRGNGFYQKGNPAIVLRLIPNVILNLEELNLPPILDSFTERTQGFFLCVGPVGQGKSTTLAAMVNRINQKRADHIVTIEDPIEFLFTNKKSVIWLADALVRETGSDAGFAALTGALRMLTSGGVAAALMLLGIGLISRGVGTTQISALAEVQVLSPGVAGAGAYRLRDRPESRFCQGVRAAPAFHGQGRMELGLNR